MFRPHCGADSFTFSREPCPIRMIRRTAFDSHERWGYGSPRLLHGCLLLLDDIARGTSTSPGRSDRASRRHRADLRRGAATAGDSSICACRGTLTGRRSRQSDEVGRPLSTRTGDSRLLACYGTSAGAAHLGASTRLPWPRRIGLARSQARRADWAARCGCWDRAGREGFAFSGGARVLDERRRGGSTRALRLWVRI